MDLATMSGEEIFAEKKRRDERRAAGLPLNPTAEEIKADETGRLKEIDERLEAEIQKEVWRLYRKFGCQVWWMSQARKTRQTPGPGDLIVFHARTGNAWWHETKTPSGEQWPAQRVFQEQCIACVWQYVIGGVLAAEEQLIKIGAAERIGGSLEPKWR